MRAPHSQPRLLLAAILGCALLLPQATPASAGPGPAAPSTGPRIADDAVVAAEHAAIEQAKAADTSVQVEALTTEFEDVVAHPDGTLTLTTSTVPVRTKLTGQWQPIDTDLRVTVTGILVPVAPLTPIEFSGGGSGPLARVQDQDGTWMEVTWGLGPLPAPAVDGPAATYPGVLPDVDLVMTATASGFSQVLVVRTADAAANPALASLQYGFSTPAQTVEENGSLQAVSADGTVAITVSAPTWWDSSTPGSDAAGPVTVSTAMPLDAAIDGSAVVIDTAPAVSGETVYPVFVDPYVSVGPQAWSYVDSAYPNAAYYNGAGGPDPYAHVGYVQATWSGDGRAHATRSYFNLPTSSIAGKQIINATYAMWNVYSSSCTARAISIHAVNPFGPGTTWNNQPYWAPAADTQTFAMGYSNACPASSPVGWNVTSIMSTVAAGGHPSANLGVKAVNESDTLTWRKFGPAGTLTVHYNTVPAPPTNMTVTPCFTDCQSPFATHLSTPTISVSTYDADGGNLWTTFQIFDTTAPGGGAGNLVRQSPSLYTAQGLVSWTVSPGLPEGNYWIRAASGDGTINGPWSSWQYLVVDRSGPAAATVTFPPTQAGTTPETRAGSVFDPVTFTFGLPANEHIAAVVYSWNDIDHLVLPPTRPACGSTTTNGLTVLCITSGQTSIPVSLLPPSESPKLRVVTWDGAGNRQNSTTAIDVFVHGAAASGRAHAYTVTSSGYVDANAAPVTLSLGSATPVTATAPDPADPENPIDVTVAHYPGSGAASTTGPVAPLANRVETSVWFQPTAPASTAPQQILSLRTPSGTGYAATYYPGTGAVVVTATAKNGTTYTLNGAQARNVEVDDWLNIAIVWEEATRTLKLITLSASADPGHYTAEIPSGFTGTGTFTISSATAAVTGHIHHPVLAYGPPPASAAPLGNFDSAGSTSATARLHGWAFDPNDTTAPSNVAVHRNGTPLGQFPANVERTDVNNVYGISGAHGFALTIPGQPLGTHAYCIYAIDSEQSTPNVSLGCRNVTITAQQPIGNYEAATSPASGKVQLSGWALDLDDKSVSIPVAVYRDGAGISWFPTNILRTDVNNAHNTTGTHGFTINLNSEPAGTHSYCVYAIDDSGLAGNPLIACRTVTVS